MAKPFDRLKPALLVTIATMTLTVLVLLVLVATAPNDSQSNTFAVVGSSILASIALVLCIGFLISGESLCPLMHHHPRERCRTAPWIAKLVTQFKSESSQAIGRRMLLSGSVFSLCFAIQTAVLIWSAVASNEVRSLSRQLQNTTDSVPFTQVIDSFERVYIVVVITDMLAITALIGAYLSTVLKFRQTVLTQSATVTSSREPSPTRRGRMGVIPSQAMFSLGSSPSHLASTRRGSHSGLLCGPQMSMGSIVEQDASSGHLPQLPSLPTMLPGSQDEFEFERAEPITSPIQGESGQGLCQRFIRCWC